MKFIKVDILLSIKFTTVPLLLKSKCQKGAVAKLTQLVLQRLIF
ncbi:hypothetical protein ACN077_14140 [Clostridium chromiireducens]